MVSSVSSRIQSVPVFSVSAQPVIRPLRLVSTGNDTVSFAGNKDNKGSFIQRITQKSIDKMKDLKRRTPHNVVVISGPSGVGKDTIIGELRKKGYELQTTVSYTTRPPRPGEIDGVHYHFISKEKFDEMDKNGEFFEQNRLKNGTCYGGTPMETETKRLGHDVVLNISSDAASKIKNKFGKSAVLIFIKPPSMEEVEKRLISRGTDSPEDIKIRLANGLEQFKYIDEFDKVILNDKLDDAASQALKYLNHRQGIAVRIINFVIKILSKIVK